MSEKKNNSDKYIALLSILIGNAIVVYGVLYMNWNFFMVLYSYWFAEFISSVFAKIKYRTLMKRKEIMAQDSENDSSGRFLFLFVYWVFIIVLAGFVAAPENTYKENLLVIFFMNKAFNINLLFAVITEFVLYYHRFVLAKEYNPQEVLTANSMVNKRTMIMHISIIFGAFGWFAMHHERFFIHLDPGKYGDYVFMLIFVAVRVIGESISLRSIFKESNRS